MSYYYDLGTYTLPITTSSREAQAWFDRGLLWRYAFNHEESLKCFQKAIEHDPGCAMAHWGIAHASGPFYNKPWGDFVEAELSSTLAVVQSATQRANASARDASPLEQALIATLSRRYPSDRNPGSEQLRRWDDAYADAMRDVHAAFPSNPDVSALFAEAMMNRTPWQLWDLESGGPAPDADTREIIDVLERALRLNDERRQAPHPGLLHMYIHAMEMSPHPERALRAADALRHLSPDAGHLLHMPSHIDMLCGDYYAALVANERAIEADRSTWSAKGRTTSTHSRGAMTTTSRSTPRCFSARANPPLTPRTS